MGIGMWLIAWGNHSCLSVGLTGMLLNFQWTSCKGRIKADMQQHSSPHMTLISLYSRLHRWFGCQVVTVSKVEKVWFQEKKVPAAARIRTTTFCLQLQVNCSTIWTLSVCCGFQRNVAQLSVNELQRMDKSRYATTFESPYDVNFTLVPPP